MSQFTLNPTDDEIRDAWMRKYPDTIYTRNQYYRNASGVYRFVDQMIVENEITDILISAKDRGVRPTSNKVASVKKLTEAAIFKDANLLDGKPDLFAFNNGVMNLKTRKFSKHSKDNYVATVVDYDYDPDATCPNFLSIIKRLDNETQLHIQEFLGYCLTTETHHEISLWLYGPPGSGKSTIIKGFMAALGPYSRHLPTRCFNGDRFGFSRVVGARLFIATEVPRRGLTDTSDYKAFVSGEPIIVEMKHKDAFTYNPMGKLVWAMNFIPSVDFLNDGIGRRISIIVFPPLPESKRDPNFSNLIAKEGPGIFNWAFQGLISLRKRGKFLIPESVRQAKEQFARGSSAEQTSEEILKRFIKELCAVGGDLMTQAGPLGDEIQSYCSMAGLKVLTAPEISAGLQSLGYRKSQSKGLNYYHGLSINS